MLGRTKKSGASKRLRLWHLQALAALVMAALALLVAGCSSDDASDADAPADGPTTTAAVTTSAPEATTTAPETTTTEPLTDEQQILATVDGFWQSFLDANDPPDPDHPDLARYRTGEALDLTISNIDERISLNQAIRLPEDSVFEHEAVITEVVDARAEVRDCLHDDSILYDRASEIPLNDHVATTYFTMSLVRSGGLWKVDSVVTDHEVDGIAPCV